MYLDDLIVFFSYMTLRGIIYIAFEKGMVEINGFALRPLREPDFFFRGTCITLRV